MRSPLVRLLLPALLLGSLTAACASTDTESSIGVPRRGDREAIERLIERRELVTNRGDANAFAGLFTDDAVIMPTNRTNIVGAPAIKKWEHAFAEEYQVETELATDEVTLLGSWAYVRLRVSGTLTPRQGGDPVRINGKELAVLQRQPDGNWKISRLMGNSNVSASRSPLSFIE
jgi:uncharacterized protein (TIGR02246 family)